MVAVREDTPDSRLRPVLMPCRSAGGRAAGGDDGRLGAAAPTAAARSAQAARRRPEGASPLRCMSHAAQSHAEHASVHASFAVQPGSLAHAVSDLDRQSSNWSATCQV